MAKSTTTKVKKQITNEDHWSNRRSKPKDEGKKIAPESKEIDKKNIVTGTRKRSNVNYKDLQLGRKVKKIARASNNCLEKRQTSKIEKKSKRSRATSKSSTKK